MTNKDKLEVAVEKEPTPAAVAKTAEAEAALAAKEQAAADKAEQARREQAVKEGKQVFQEKPTGVFDFEPVFAKHATETTVDVRAAQHGSDVA